MAAYEVLLLNTAIPQIQAAQSGDTYVVPRDIAFSTVASFAAGAEATPSIVATGDTNTGIWFPAADTVAISTGGISRLRLDSSGNLGLGVTPSAWGSSFKGMQIGSLSGVSLMGYSSAAEFGNNFYFDTAYRYAASTSASRYTQSGGAHTWYIAPSGTAGNAITFTQAMTLDASGNLLLGLTSGNAKFDMAAGSGAAVAAIRVRSLSTNSNGFNIVTDSVTDNIYLNNFYNAAMLFGTNNTERARITSGGIFQVSSGGSVQVGGTAARATTAGTNRLDIFNGTAPVGTLTNGISIYSSSGEAYVMDAAGNATLFSPHDAETNEWIFKSKHTPTGKVLKIDVERLLKFVNDHFGLDAVHEFVEE